MLDPGGKPVGVRIIDPAYDPSSAENSVLFLAANMTAADPAGPRKPAWARYAGRYVGRFSRPKCGLRYGMAISLSTEH